MEIADLERCASEGSFFSYIAGTAAVMLQKYGSCMQAHGVTIDNYRTTLPMRKGLSSSAASCVLVVKCIAAVYGIDCSMQEVKRLFCGVHFLERRREKRVKLIRPFS